MGSRLTPKLREILPLLLRGATNPEMARLTQLAQFTMANRRSKITKILGTFSIYEKGQKIQVLGIDQYGAACPSIALNQSEVSDQSEATKQAGNQAPV